MSLIEVLAKGKVLIKLYLANLLGIGVRRLAHRHLG